MTQSTQNSIFFKKIQIKVFHDIVPAVTKDLVVLLGQLQGTDLCTNYAQI